MIQQTDARRPGMTVCWMVLFLLGGCATSSAQLVGVGGYRLWMNPEGHGSPTVVFITGGTANSALWASIPAEVRKRSDVRTIVYDRAGIGKSELRPGEYRVDDDAAELVRGLDALDVRGPIVLVCYGYAGFVATLVATSDARVAGVVLVDVFPVSFFDDAEVAVLEARFTISFDALRRENPGADRAMIPLLRAYPETARRVRGLTYPPSLPIIDIIPDSTYLPTFDELLALRLAHRAFVEASPAREAVFARRSLHNVMRDRPDLVSDSVVRMVQRVRGH